MRINALYTLALVAGASAAPHPQYRVDAASYYKTELVGDGSPRQRYLYEQVTTPVQCNGGDDGDCSTGSTETETSTISFNAGVDGIPWINGGFAVSESKSVGETSTCGNKPGAKSVCIWTRVAHTGYESQKWLIETNGMSPNLRIGGKVYIWSPNEREGHANICAYDDECEEGKGAQKWGAMSDGDKLWEAISNKGGPRPYVWGDDRWS